MSIDQNTPTQVHGTHDMSAHSTYTPQGKQRWISNSVVLVCYSSVNQKSQCLTKRGFSYGYN